MRCTDGAVSALVPLLTGQEGSSSSGAPSPLCNLSERQGPARSGSPAPPYHDPAEQRYLPYSATPPPSPCDQTGQEDLPHFGTSLPSYSERSEQEDLSHSASCRPPKAIWKHYIPLILNLLVSSWVCFTHGLKLDPQHHPEPTIHHMFSDDICSEFTLDQGYTLVQLYWEVCTFDKDSFEELPQPKQLKLSRKVCSLVFESSVARLLLLLWNKGKECHGLEEAVVRQVLVLLVSCVLKFVSRPWPSKW